MFNLTGMDTRESDFKQVTPVRTKYVEYCVSSCQFLYSCTAKLRFWFVCLLPVPGSDDSGAWALH